MEYPITNCYMDLNAERLGKDSHCAQYVRAALQEIEEKFNLLSRDDLDSISGPFLHDLSKGAPAEPLDFDLSHTLPRWHLEPSYAQEVTVSFDGAEGGAVWVGSDDESIAIRGPVAMRELARMLNAFADGYTGPMEPAQ